MKKSKATPHNSRLAAQAPLRQLRHGICVAKMLDNVGLRYPHRASGAKALRTLRPLPLLRFAVSATGGAHLCSIQYYLRFWLSICRTSSPYRHLELCGIALSSSRNTGSWIFYLFCIFTIFSTPERIGRISVAKRLDAEVIPGTQPYNGQSCHDHQYHCQCKFL